MAGCRQPKERQIHATCNQQPRRGSFTTTIRLVQQCLCVFENDHCEVEFYVLSEISIPTVKTLMYAYIEVIVIERANKRN